MYLLISKTHCFLSLYYILRILQNIHKQLFLPINTDIFNTPEVLLTLLILYILSVSNSIITAILLFRSRHNTQQALITLVEKKY